LKNSKGGGTAITSEIPLRNSHYFTFEHLVKIDLQFFADATWAPFFWDLGLSLVWQDIAAAYDTHGRSFMD
jgi:hypothetical protein